MIRNTTLLAILIVAVTGVALFYLKHEVTNLEDELKTLNRSIVAEREAVHVLKAEWSHFNDVGRLKGLSMRYLELRPTEPKQLKESRGFFNIQVVDDPDLEVIIKP